MSKNNRKKPWLLLIILFFALTNIIWIIVDQSPPWWDMAAHSAQAVDYFSYLRQGDFAAIVHDPVAHPPLQYLLTAPFFLIFGVRENIPQLSLLAPLAILLFSVYNITFYFSKNKNIALAAGILTLGYPIMTHFSRIYFLDFTLTAWTALSIYLLLQTKHYGRTLWCVAAGAGMGLGLLSKWSLIIFVAGPALCLLIETLRDKKISRRERIRQFSNMLLIIAMAGIISFPWYRTHFSVIEQLATETAQAFAYTHDIKQVRPWGITNLGFYLFGRHALAWGVSWPLLFLFLGMSFIARKKKGALFLFSWFALPYLFFTLFISTKEVRHILPLIPSLAIITVMGLHQLKKYRRLLFISVFVLTGIMWLETSWHVPLLGPSFRLFGNPPRQMAWAEVYGYAVSQNQETNIAYGYTWPTRYNTQIRQLVAKIQEDKKKSGVTAISRIAVVPNYQYLTGANVKFFGTVSGLKADYELSRSLRTTKEIHAAIIAQSDYVITKQGYQGPAVWNPHADILTAAEQNPDSELFAPLTLIGQWEILTPEDPQPVTMRLYKRNH